MGSEKEFDKVKLFTGFIYHDSDIYRAVKARMESIFSAVDLESEPFDFVFTTYYNKEMGTPLYKRFISFTGLIDPVRLPGIKILTNRIEIETALPASPPPQSPGHVSLCRTINIDPGYISHANVILATTKNHFHRVPLQQGIYAHMEYIIKKKNTLSTLEWTYPDFCSPQYMEFFQKLLAVYKETVKEKRG